MPKMSSVVLVMNTFTKFECSAFFIEDFFSSKIYYRDNLLYTVKLNFSLSCVKL